ncbi:hypothetical protein lse_1854 [Listeria seeligeri serovar 1/2b str. SLCC3954]|nr:hypothetical protein lse_1854 [Listeria seeligeri serovar 1/2b str. SLCC3954]
MVLFRYQVLLFQVKQLKNEHHYSKLKKQALTLKGK